jgi:hypothetical protein
LLAGLSKPTLEELAELRRRLASHKPAGMPAYLAARVEQAIAVEAAKRASLGRVEARAGVEAGRRGPQAGVEAVRRGPQAEVMSDSNSSRESDHDDDWRERLSKVPPPRPPRPDSRARQQRSGR